LASIALGCSSSVTASVTSNVDGGGGSVGDAGPSSDAAREADTERPSARSYDVIGAGNAPCGVGYYNEWTWGTRFRLDILPDGSAIVWGPRRAYTGKTTYMPSVVFPTGPFCQIDDHGYPDGAVTISSDLGWAFDMDASGQPGKARAVSIDAPWCGQTPTSLSSFDGAAGPDTTSPSFSIEGGGPLAGVVLPWDPVSIIASEGVDPETWRAAMTATLDGAPIGFAPVAVAGTTDVDRLELPSAPWPPRSGKVLHVGVADGIADHSGNVGAGMQTDVTLADLGSPSTAVLFDGSSAPVLVGLTTRPAGDPACEAAKPCAAAHVANTPFGLAARLSTAGATAVRVRMSSTVSGRGPRDLLVRLVAPTGAVSEMTAHATNGAWEETTVSIPSGAVELGVEISLAKSDCYPSYTLGDVAIGSITVE
jgi:hypothetical protein